MSRDHKVSLEDATQRFGEVAAAAEAGDRQLILMPSGQTLVLEIEGPGKASVFKPGGPMANTDPTVL